MLLNKPYVNGVTLREQNLSLKSFMSFEFILSILKRFKSFQSGTVGLCRSNSCKVMSYQILSFEKNSATRLESNHTWEAQVRLLDDGIIFKI